MLIAYFIAVIVLTVPFWIAGGMVGIELLPGLPLAGLAVVAPAAAATLVVGLTSGPAGIGRLYRRLGEIGRLSHWGWILSLGIAPGVAVATWLWRWGQGESFGFVQSPVAIAVMALLFLVSAAAEEIGWSGFALDRLTERFGWLGGALLLGLFWAGWHVPALIEAGRSADWIAWWSVWTVVSRLVMSALYFRTGRNLGSAIVYHAASNLSWQLAPDGFDPRVEAILITAVAVVWLGGGRLIAMRK